MVEQRAWLKPVCTLARACSDKSAGRAAVLHVVKHELRDVHIKSDSAYVVKGCLKYRFTWDTLGWHRVKNADLWRELHSLLQARGNTVHISKVKGHASERDVRSGRVARRDKVCNDAADRLACTGACMHTIDPEIANELKLRAAVAKDVQSMMVDIMEARAPLAKRVTWKSATSEVHASA